jgi:eukaryotic translation initiation factor 2C
LQKFGVSVASELLTVHGRILDAPTVLYAGNKPVRTTDGSWNMVGVSVAQSCREIKKWHWIYITLDGQRPNDHSAVKQGIKAFSLWIRQQGGIPIAEVPIATEGIQIDTMEGSEVIDVNRAFKGLQDTGKLPDLALIVLPDSADKAVYNAVKRLADINYGFHTICMVRRKFLKQRGSDYDLQYFANVMLKVNLKFGGINHRVKDLGLISEGKTMVVGYDVIHPTNLGVKVDMLPSQVGMVSSIDDQLGQWPSVSWSQKGGQEMLDSTLKEAFKTRLKLWQTGQSRNGKSPTKPLPQNIIIYRDGVSESQFQQVIGQELPLIREACREMYPNKGMPSISIIVSVKRHHTRFYPASDARTRSNNTKPGTVVDRGVTLARYWDFFVVAHNALQGTARPARYTVLLDEIFGPRYGPQAANRLEKLTHEMCYTFQRATKAISICPPAYYADIVCTRARIHLADVFEDLETATTLSGDFVGGSSSVEMQAAMGRKVHPKIQNDMYYI